MNQKAKSLHKKLLFFFSPFYKFRISGKSMIPAINFGDIVFVNRFAYWFRYPKINDIIAFKDPRDGKILIKRIVKIENGKYFVLGDNQTHSTDSRKFGMIGKSEIVGKVILH